MASHATPYNLARFKIPFSDTPRSKTEALVADTPRQSKPLATLKIILEELFGEFLSKSGKHRTFIKANPNLANYATDADENMGEVKIQFRVHNQEIEKITPAIQFVLGIPVLQPDLNTGFERNRHIVQRAQVAFRSAYKVNCILFTTAHSGSVMADLGHLADNIITKYIPAIFGGRILSPQQNWQLCFPKMTQPSDIINRREEVRASFSQIHWGERTLELFFEQVDYVNLGEAPITEVPVEFGLDGNPMWSGPQSILTGTKHQFVLTGRQDAIPLSVTSSDPKILQLRKIGTFTYEGRGRIPGRILLQAVYENFEPAQLEVEIA